MKILVYTLGVQGLVSEKAISAIQAKEADLKAKYPGIAIMVIPGPYVDGDKVEMIDMTPSAYPSLGVLGPAPTFPPTTYPLNPYGGIGTSVPFQTTGGGVPMADHNNGAGVPITGYTKFIPEGAGDAGATSGYAMPWWPGVTSTYTIGDKGPQGVTVDKPCSQPLGNWPGVYINPHQAAIAEANAIRDGNDALNREAGGLGPVDDFAECPWFKPDRCAADTVIIQDRVNNAGQTVVSDVVVNNVVNFPPK